MCGIAGVFSSGDSRDAVTTMTSFLSHRGPDDSGIEAFCSSEGKLLGTFGSRRLAILDLTQSGHQPMFSPDGNLCITYNGEIYNFLELRHELEQEGARFRSASDTEVLLVGWGRYGRSFLDRLRGMFALAIWDSAAQEGYLARDTFGIKPLYYSERDGDVLFVSEVKALLATGRIPRKASAEAVASFLSTGSVAEPLTIIEGVRAVPPGCVLAVTRNGDHFVVGKPTRFASIFPSAPLEKTDTQPTAQSIREALRESVHYHLVSDVPVGVFLSGGIDSSAVAGLASEVSESPIESFTVTFSEADYSEAAPARDAARRFNTNHHEVHLSGRDLLDALPDVFAAMDQPSLDGLNTFVVSRAVHAFGIKVVLSGLGGDELFGGYPSFRRARQLTPLWKLPRVLRRIGAAVADRFDDPRADRISTLLRDRTLPHAAYRASRTLFGDNQISRLMRARHKPGSTVAPKVDDRGIEALTPMQQVSLYETTGYMRNTLLRDSDVFSMAHGLELRVPLVDRQVVRAAQDAAAARGLEPGAKKPVLVEAVRDLLTPENLTRPKRGFTLPFEAWMRNELFSEVDSVLSHAAENNLCLDQSEVSKIWASFQKRRRGVTWSRPWALYTLLRWASQNDISLERHGLSAMPPPIRPSANPRDATDAYEPAGIQQITGRHLA